MTTKVALWLAIRLASLVYPVDPATLEGIAWRESRYTATAQRGTCCGAFQTESRFSRYSCAQLKNPLVSALEAARLLTWAQRHCGGDGLHWYRHGHCAGHN